MKKTDMAYMAGIFDGEGSISIGRHKKRENWNPSYCLKVTIVMCNPYIPNLFRMAFGGAIACYQPRIDRKLPTWHWYLSSKKAAFFLETLGPYLRLKRDEARLAIAFQKNKRYIHTSRGKAYTAAQVAVLEAQKILMTKMHNKTEVFFEY